VADLTDGYFTRDGKLHTWPSRKRSDIRQLILRHLGEKFIVGRQYSELEINEILRSWLIFEDHVLIRRELFQAGILGRTPDGSRYWKVERSEEG
jgi:hypothetical protein